MIIAVDLGKKTTGIAISNSTIATPYKTITHTNLANVVNEISKICEEENATKVIVGFVEGKIKSYFLDFAQKLKEKLPQVEIVMWDETLTSQQALETMINIKLPKNKRRQREHEIAASLILQSYLDN